MLSITGTLASTLGQTNPIRYRGYYYDSETGFYYCQSRYYAPEIGRWINADGYVSTGQGILGYNMYAYCGNNPINSIDKSGGKPGDLFDTMDEAAIDFAKYINGKSIDENVEYASYMYSVIVKETRTVMVCRPSMLSNPFKYFIFKMLYGDALIGLYTYEVEVTKYTYKEPKKGSQISSKPPINWFGKDDVVARMHTHGAYVYGYENDEFSWEDKKIARRLNVYSYLATPAGWVIKYDPSKTILDDEIVIDKNVPKDSNHPWYN